MGGKGPWWSLVQYPPASPLNQVTQAITHSHMLNIPKDGHLTDPLAPVFDLLIDDISFS